MNNIEIENKTRNYILITPAKNEDKNIGLCIQSVVSQTITPNLWIIIDDGSIDNTFEIIQDAKNKHHWIESIQLNDTIRDLTIHISEVIKKGFDFAIDHSKKHNLKYDYIAFLDADMIVQDKNFFEKLIVNFEKDSHLGIASGEIQIQEKTNNLSLEKRRTDTVSGGEMMCSRDFFNDIDDVIPLSFSWESVLRIQAIRKGWKVKRFKDIQVIQTRQTSSAEGIKRGYYIKGTSAYYLNFNPFIVIAKGIKYCFTRPYYIGIVYLYGYFSSRIQRKEQIK
jgi:glycosyltransferase involved in cell wall biosynthesis